MAALGEVPGQGIVYRQGGVVTAESSFIRERFFALGMSMKDLAERVGVSASYMSQVCRGRRNMGARVQALVEATLGAQATVASAQACLRRPPRVLWDWTDAQGISQNEVARRTGISSAHLSQFINGKASPSAGVLKRLHAVLFHRIKSEERVVPAELNVLGWSKGDRSGMVVHGEGGPGRRGCRRWIGAAGGETTGDQVALAATRRRGRGDPRPMTGFGPYEIVPFLLLPVLLILAETSVAIICKEDATVEWVLSAALRAMLATGL